MRPWQNKISACRSIFGSSQPKIINEEVSVDKVELQQTREALIASSVRPQSTLLLYHGLTDEMVQFEQELCNSESTLTYSMATSAVVQQCQVHVLLIYMSIVILILSQKHMKIPVVAIGVLEWMQTAINSPQFHNGDSFVVWLPCFLSLLHYAADNHTTHWWS